MSEEATSQEVEPVEEQLPTDEEVALMTDEQRDGMLSGEEVVWEDEQKTVLDEGGEAGEKKTPDPAEEKDVVEALDAKLAEEVVSTEQVEKSNAFKQLRNRAQTAESSLEESERLNADLSAENKAYKESLERLAPEPEDKYDLSDPDQLDEYIKEQVAEGKEGKEKEKDDDVPAGRYTAMPDEVTAAGQARFIDSAGKSYDEFITANPSGKMYFRAKDNETGKEFVLFDREVLGRFDTDMVERLGEDLYIKMWGTREQPGIMAHWRDNAPQSELLITLNADDPVIAVTEVFKGLVKQIKEAESVTPTPTTEGTPTPTAPVPPPSLPPRGFGPTPTTEEDANFNKKRPAHEISDKQVADMSDEERDKWLGEE